MLDTMESPKKSVNMTSSTPKVSNLSQQQHSTPQMASPAATSKQEEEGKEFFRQAKNKLSWKQYNHLTAIIKKLNNRQQNKQETVAEAKKLFGAEHDDLFVAFSALLNHTLDE